MMKTIITLMFLLSTTATAQISRQECLDQGGEVVGDIGDGAIFQPDYLCANTNEAPTDAVVATGDEPIASEGEVCCGGTGEGIAAVGAGGFPGGELPLPPASAVRPEMTRQECTGDRNGTIVGDIGNGAIHSPDYICESSGMPPIGTIVPLQGEPIAIEGEVCCGPNVTITTELDTEGGGGALPGDGDGLPLPPPSSERPALTRQECTDDMDGTIVGDIGNGAIHRDDYICESNGMPPIGTIVFLEGEPIAIEGEVCCGPNFITAEVDTERPVLTRQECTDDMDGTIVGDIGDGTMHRPDYICESNGMPPIGTIVPLEGEPIADEGEVCCGPDFTTAELDTEGSGGTLPGDGDGLPLPPSAERPALTRQECTDDMDGTIVGDIGDGAIHRDDYICESNDLPPIGTIVPLEGEPIAFEGEVCCGPNVTIATTGTTNEVGLPSGNTERMEMTRQECTDEMDGMIVGDIGNGAIHRDDYLCESDGLPPIGTIVPLDGEPIAREGEVCCGTMMGMDNDVTATTNGGDIVALNLNETATADRPEISRQNCTDQGGEIVGDIGDGSTQRDDYVCESNGEPPIANIVPQDGEPIPIEGEVCCGPSGTSGAFAMAPTWRMATYAILGAIFLVF